MAHENAFIARLLTTLPAATRSGGPDAGGMKAGRAAPDGRPVMFAMPGFVGAASYGHTEFFEQCDAVVMGRTAFEPTLESPSWPWPGKGVFVLTSRPLPTTTPGDVVVSQGGPAGLVDQLRSAGLDGDVQLLGGPQTVHAFLELGAVDRLEIIVLPVLLGTGLPFSGPGAGPIHMRLQGQQAFPEGAVELDYLSA
jgi:dihydrofolate reductase